MAFDVNGALKAGYSRQEIADYLASQSKFDVAGARKAGYTDDEIIGHLAGAPARKANAEETNPKVSTGANPLNDKTPVDPQAGKTAQAPAASAPDTSDAMGDSLGSAIMDAVPDARQPVQPRGSKSVMDNYTPPAPTPAQQQADADKRLGYGAGPVSPNAVAEADRKRSGLSTSNDPTVNKIAKEMERRGETSLGDRINAARDDWAYRQQKAEEWRSFSEWTADTLSSLGQGTVTLAQLPTNIVAPDSGFADVLRLAQRELQGQESDVLKAQRANFAERIRNEPGFFDKYFATVEELVTNPALGLSEGFKQVPMFLGVLGAAKLTSSLVSGGLTLAERASPTLALGEAISGGAIRTAVTGGAATAGGRIATMVMAGGDAAQATYERLTDKNQTPLSVWSKNPDYRRLLAEGKTSDEAIREIATAKARLAAVITAPLGLLGYMGAESAIVARGMADTARRVFTPQGAAKIFGKEIIGEQAEEGGTQAGGNYAVSTVDPSQSITEDVPQAMGTALVTAGPFAGAAVVNEMRGNETPGVTSAGLIAAQRLDPQSYDPATIDPSQTVNRPAPIIGVTAPDASAVTQATTVDEAIEGADQAAGSLDVNIPAPSYAAPATIQPQLQATPTLMGTAPAAPAAPVAPASPLAAAIDPAVERQFGLDTLRLGADNARQGPISTASTLMAPRPQRINGTLAAELTDTDLSKIIQDDTMPALVRRGAQVELDARQREAGNAAQSETRREPTLDNNFTSTQYDGRVEPTLNAGQPAVPAAGAAAVDGRVEPTLNSNFLTLPAASMRDSAVAPVGGEGAARAARENAQRNLEGWAKANNEPVPAQLTNESPPELESAVNEIAQLVNSQFAGRIYAYHDTDPQALNGIALGKVAFINTADVSRSAASTSLHEFKHTVEQIALAETQAGLTNTPAQQFVAAIDSIYDDMTEAGKRAYLEKFFRKEELDAITDPVEREVTIRELMLDPVTRSEMTADFLGNRATDRQFWQELAAADPQGFKGFVEKWLKVIDNLLQALRGKANQGNKESARVDQYVRDLNRAKMVAREALVAYSKATRGQATAAQSAQTQQTTSQPQPSAAQTENTPQFSAAQRGGTVDQVGQFKIRTQKDGTLGVAGDVEQIRALLPEDIKGRQVPGGMVFTTSDAPRVRAALEGRKVAYSRAGQVLDKLPMKNGKYVGAPDKYNTPGKITTLRKNLRMLADEGAPGRYWYENSSREVLQMVGGNVQEARKFVALLAIYSPQAKVDANSTFALRAWAQYKAGQPIGVKTRTQDNKALAALEDVDAFWSGEKTGNFFFNLLREIDPSTEGKQGATIDMWMMRAAEYINDAPTATQYAFMENETNRLAQELGWEPQQVQAAIWVAMKARMENEGVKKRTEASSEKNGWIRYDYPIKNGRPVKTRVILNAQAHRDNWLKHAFAHKPTKDDTAQAKFDFSDGVRRHVGQLSWEARPGRSTNVLPGVNDAPYEQQVEFQQAVQKALYDDNGIDLLAYKLGLLVDGPDILAPGVWQGEIAAGMQKRVALAPAKGDDGKTSIDPAQKQAIDTYAAVLGLVLRQEGVGYHRPFYKGKKSDANGVDIDVGRTLTPDEAQALWGAIDERMRADGVADWESGAGMISTPTGMRVVNFGAVADNKAFQSLVEDAAGTLAIDEVSTVFFGTDGDLITNDWKENPNGESYQSRISAAGSPDLLGWTRDVLAPRVQAVFNEFSSRYGWGDSGQVNTLFGQADQQDSAEVTTPPATKPARSSGEPQFSRRQPNTSPFYSQLARAIDEVPARLASQPAQQWKAWLASNAGKLQIKREEIEWTGINDYLDLRGKDKVSKDEIADYLRNNGVQVEEVMKSPETRRRVQYNDQTEEWDVLNEDGSVYDSYPGTDQGELDAVAAARSTGGGTKYNQYTLPGGENYRELLLTLPSFRDGRTADEREFARLQKKEAEEDGLFRADFDRYTELGQRLGEEGRARALSKSDYRSSHWDEANILAHIRFNDRTDADGKKVLFIEELQSDWAQEGRKKGFRSEEDSRVQGLREKRMAAIERLESMDADDSRRGEAMTAVTQLNAELAALGATPTSRDNVVGAIPAAPFVTDTKAWLSLGVKRMITYAVDNGYDKIAFVTGEQSADRYDLSKQVEKIYYSPPGSKQAEKFGTVLKAFDKRGREVINKSVTPEELPDYIGKDVADRLLNAEANSMGVRSLSGVDLKVGGEGMKSFYDRIVPQVVGDVLKKIGGGKMETVTLNIAKRDEGQFGLGTFRADQARVVARAPGVFQVWVTNARGVEQSRGGNFASKAAAEQYIADMAPGQTQPGFAITDAMREKVSDGLPMFSRRQRDTWMPFGRDEVGSVNFGPGAKAYDVVATVARNVFNKVSMKPVSPELKRALDKMKLEVQRAQNRAAAVAVNLKDVPEDQRKMISDVIEGELAVGVTPPQQVLALAASMQSIMTEQSQELVRLGMLSQEAADRWDGKYLPRFYESKLKDEATAWMKAAKSLFGRTRVMQGVKGDSLKARGMFQTIDVADLPNYQSLGWEIRDDGYDPTTSTEVQVWRDFTRAERDNMGEIRDAMFRFVMGYTRTQRDVALGRLYESLAANYASRTQKEGYVKVPDSVIDDTGADGYSGVRRYGKLAGMWVPREVMDHLSAQDAVQNGVLKLYKAGLSKWKEGKTVLNPVSHANNVMSNTTMAHFAGISYWDAHKYAGTVKDLVSNNPMLKEAEDAGLFGGTFNQAEIVKSMPPQLRAMAGMSESKLKKLGEGIWDIMAFTVSWNGKKYGARPVMQWAYEAEDQFFRYLIYRDARQRGLSPDDAVEYSQNFIFTYDDLPKGARLIRDAAVPFFSYAYKVTPVLVRTALEYPWRYAAPAAIVYAINQAMYAIAAGLDDDDWKELLYRYATDKQFREQAKALEADERQNLPPWMKGYSFVLGVPKAIRLGMDEVTNLPMFLDISRIFPGGDIADVASNTGGVPLPQPLNPSNPLLSTIAAMLWNKDSFFGKEIVDENDTRAEASEKRLKWLWQQFTPAIAVGNYHFDRIANAFANVTGKPVDVGFREYTGIGRDGLPVQPDLTALQTVGIKARPVDLDMSKKISEGQKRKVLQSIDAEISRLRRLERKGAISPEAMDKEIDRQREKKDRLREGLTVDGDEVE